jgi:hypothetical protein
MKDLLLPAIQPLVISMMMMFWISWFIGVVDPGLIITSRR